MNVEFLSLIDNFALANSGLFSFGLMLIVFGAVGNIRGAIEKLQDDLFFKVCGFMMISGLVLVGWSLYNILSVIK